MGMRQIDPSFAERILQKYFGVESYSFDDSSLILYKETPAWAGDAFARHIELSLKLLLMQQTYFQSGQRLNLNWNLLNRTILQQTAAVSSKMESLLKPVIEQLRTVGLQSPVIQAAGEKREETLVRERETLRDRTVSRAVEGLTRQIGASAAVRKRIRPLNGIGAARWKARFMRKKEADLDKNIVEKWFRCLTVEETEQVWRDLLSLSENRVNVSALGAPDLMRVRRTMELIAKDGRFRRQTEGGRSSSSQAQGDRTGSGEQPGESDHPAKDVPLFPGTRSMAAKRRAREGQMLPGAGLEEPERLVADGQLLSDEDLEKFERRLTNRQLLPGQPSFKGNREEPALGEAAVPARRAAGEYPFPKAGAGETEFQARDEKPFLKEKEEETGQDGIARGRLLSLLDREPRILTNLVQGLLTAQGEDTRESVVTTLFRKYEDRIFDRFRPDRMGEGEADRGTALVSRIFTIIESRFTEPGLARQAEKEFMDILVRDFSIEEEELTWHSEKERQSLREKEERMDAFARILETPRIMAVIRKRILGAEGKTLERLIRWVHKYRPFVSSLSGDGKKREPRMLTREEKSLVTQIRTVLGDEEARRLEYYFFTRERVTDRVAERETFHMADEVTQSIAGAYLSITENERLINLLGGTSFLYLQNQVRERVHQPSTRDFSANRRNLETVMRRIQRNIGLAQFPHFLGQQWKEAQTDLLFKRSGQDNVLGETQKRVDSLSEKLEIQEKLVKELKQEQNKANIPAQVNVNDLTRQVMKKMEEELRLEKMRRGLL